MLSKNKFFLGLFIILFLTSCSQRQSSDKNTNIKTTSLPSDEFTDIYDLSTPEKAVITLETELNKKGNYDLYMARTYFSPAFLDWLSKHNITEQNMKDQFMSDLQVPDLQPDRVGNIKVTSAKKINNDLFKVEYSIDVDYSGLDYNFGPITSFSYMRRFSDEWYMDIEPEFREHGVMDLSNGIGREKIPVGARDCGMEKHEGTNSQTISQTNINSEARECFASAYQKCENVLFKEEFKRSLTSHDSRTFWWLPNNDTCKLVVLFESFDMKWGETVSFYTCTNIRIYPWNFQEKTITHQRWYAIDCFLEHLFPKKFTVQHVQSP